MKKHQLTQRFIERLKPSQRTQQIHDEKVSALYLRVYPSGSKHFYLRFQHDGLRVHRKLGNVTELSLRDARKQALNEVTQARYLSDTCELPSITFNAFAEEFFNRYPRHWKTRTLVKNKSAFRLQIKPWLGERLVFTLTRKDVEQWFVQLAHIPSSANQALVLLSVMMQQCEAWGYREANSNPCRGFSRYKEQGRSRYLSHDELRRLWSALDSFEREKATAVMLIRLLVYTGCRSSEVRTLKWKDYRGGHWYLTDSKTGAKTVYLCSAAIEYLKAWSSDSEYLFHSTDPSKPMLSCTLWHAWKQIRQRAKLEDVRLHDLRHTYASVAIQAKVNVLVLGRLLGHAQSETTLKYIHLNSADVCQAASDVSAAMARGMRL